MTPKEILTFWFDELTSSEKFQKNYEIDLKIKEKFESTLISAKKGELSNWRETPEGRLAEIIVLDQFSRNIYRDKPEAFESDPQSLTLSQEAIRVGADSELTPTQLAFLYMPFMHSESIKIHETAMTLFSKKGLEENLEYEIKHKVIIERFGRYPHRNHILGRESTPEEIEFLKGPNSSF